MVQLDDLVAFLNTYLGFNEKILRIDTFLVNGLQVAGEPEINKITFGVSANLRLFEAAVEAGAQAVLAHHSMNPPASVYFEADVIFTRRLKFLWAHRLSLIGYHYLLDTHPDIGHNASIARALGAQILEPYGHQNWGCLAEIPGGADLDWVMATCRGLFNNNGVYYPFGKTTVRRIVCLTGSGAPRPDDYADLVAAGVDCFITGEPREWNQELCREAGISMVAAGHYNTEVIGLKNLMRVIEGQFDVITEFIDIPNPV